MALMNILNDIKIMNKEASEEATDGSSDASSPDKTKCGNGAFLLPVFFFRSWFSKMKISGLYPQVCFFFYAIMTWLTHKRMYWAIS